ncbi:30S ribosomal protein S20 [Mesobacillus sp. AQ2]|jgi:small subunit ribosomal protein S20|uniref:30S ribosomal protein S20 n=1 Tax=Bacillaceae TaxID=186817 RepID=UPI0011A58A42|nr:MULTISPECIES: 30S ribosomal protein S20 [Bacillaceae]MCM3122478.1 30S ribosomal protein S20 [Mesobacillus sp. MER 33]MCM3232442.1 30S ribosomal protein S20 [Mesobacillus sp. MER 48]WHX39378.1 30S ribosomal protein S20 [Mesobacillus sp. AQ2]
MPNIKSAIKRVKTSEESRAHNITVKSTMRTAVKKAEAAIVNNDTEAKASYAQAASKLDKAAAKGLIHKNAAARKKARLMKKLNANG